jgi:hypothetical protein
VSDADNAPLYRPNWRDRRDMAARKAGKATGSEADDAEAPGEGSGADEAVEDHE